MSGTKAPVGFVLSVLIIHHVVFTKARSQIFNKGFDRLNLRGDEACGGTFTSFNGTLSSPGFPDKYTDNLDCFWLIEASEDQVIRIDFTFMEIEYQRQCMYDALIVRDGDIVTSPILEGRLCGSIKPNSGPQLLTTGHQALIHFRTDYISTYKGFQLTWTTINIEECPTHPPCPSATCPTCPTCPTETPCQRTACREMKDNMDSVKPEQRSNHAVSKRSSCGENFASETGSFHSPGYPYHYTNNLDCFWTITTLVGHRINLDFKDLEVEYHRLCHYDAIVIRDGNSPMSPKIGQDICGGFNPAKGLKLSSTENKIFIHFQSDYINFKKGFSVEWTSERIAKCPPPPTCPTEILCVCPPCPTSDDCPPPEPCPTPSPTAAVSSSEISGSPSTTGKSTSRPSYVFSTESSYQSTTYYPTYLSSTVDPCIEIMNASSDNFCSPGYVRDGEDCLATCEQTNCTGNQTCIDKMGTAPATCKDTHCPNGFITSDEDVVCIDIGVGLTWQQADDYCASLGLTLAQPNNVLSLAASVFNAIGTNYWYWLGGKGSCTDLVWLDGTTVNYDLSLWQQGLPNISTTDCLVLQTSDINNPYVKTTDCLKSYGFTLCTTL